MPWLSLVRAPRREAGQYDLTGIETCPSASGNLTDRQREHNRDTIVIGCGAVDRAPPLIWPFSRDIQGATSGDAPTPARSNSHEAKMTTFDKREEGFEKKFAHDEELRFKAMARRNKLLGMWAADKLGLAGDEAAAYAKEVVLADFEEAGDVFRKIRNDFDAKGVAQSDHQIRRTMDELLDQAIAQVKAGT